MSFGQDREEEFAIAAPDLFEFFPTKAAEYLQQVDTLQSLKSCSLFGKPASVTAGGAQESLPAEEVPTTPKAEANQQRREELQCRQSSQND